MEVADSRDIVRMHATSTNGGWNDYQDLDLPGLTYQPDYLICFPSEGATTKFYATLSCP